MTLTATRYFLPSFEQAMEICAGNEFFSSTEHTLNGYRVVTFDYYMAKYTDFQKPLKDKDYQAHELRGLTFVFNTDGSLYNRYLMLNKFFNLNEVEDLLYENIKHIPVKYHQEKYDGTNITFIKLPDGSIYPKTINSFNPFFLEIILPIYNQDINLRNLIEYCLNNNIAPIFELVSFKNRVVIKYSETKLVLLQLRNNLTGEFLDLDPENPLFKGIEFAKHERIYTLDEMVELAKTLENKEGWVITLEDGTKLKKKTQWYYDRHFLFTETTTRENEIIPLILDGKIDDIIATMKEEDHENRKMIEEIRHKLGHYIHALLKECEKIKSEYTGDRKAFSLKYSKEPKFHFYVRSIEDRDDMIEYIQKYIRKNTYHLMDAKNFLDNIII